MSYEDDYDTDLVTLGTPEVACPLDGTWVSVAGGVCPKCGSDVFDDAGVEE